MPPDVLIVGQGLAGTLLAWELEKAGVSFAIGDPGHAGAATLAAAGLINPITGRRLVKSWKVDALLPAAREVYREIEAELGIVLWHDVRIWRAFADERERSVFAAKQASGELAPFVAAVESDGFWIEPAARVALPALLHGTRERWQRAGVYRAEAVDPVEACGRHACVIDCRGLACALGGTFAFVPWEYSKGEILELAVDGLRADVVLNRRHWIAPIEAGVAWAGATHEPGCSNAEVTTEARRVLEDSARVLLGRPFTVRGQRAGVRVNLPDKRPAVGRHPAQSRLGVMSGLGAKGALVAPLLARMWAKHLACDEPFDADVDVRRFARANVGGDLRPD